LAHYQIRFGAIPLENFAKLMETQEIDSKTARLVAVGMENLVGVLGLVTGQNDESWTIWFISSCDVRRLPITQGNNPVCIIQIHSGRVHGACRNLNPRLEKRPSQEKTP